MSRAPADSDKNHDKHDGHLQDGKHVVDPDGPATGEDVGEGTEDESTNCPGRHLAASFVQTFWVIRADGISYRLHENAQLYRVSGKIAEDNEGYTVDAGDEQVWVLVNVLELRERVMC